MGLFFVLLFLSLQPIFGVHYDNFCVLNSPLGLLFVFFFLLSKLMMSHFILVTDWGTSAEGPFFILHPC